MTAPSGATSRATPTTPRPLFLARGRDVSGLNDFRARPSLGGIGSHALPDRERPARS
jgi:hypothetical protein